MDYEKKYNEALERAKAYHRNELAGSRREMTEYIFPELRESDDERIRKELIDFINHYRHNTDLTTEQAKWCKEAITYLEKQKENPKSADFIPADCASSAKCEDRWHKTANSLPDNGRDVLAKDALGNYLLASFDGAQWFVSVYDGQDHPVLHTPPILEWCEIPSEKQKEPENTSASTMIPSCWAEELSLQKEQKPAEKQDYSGLTNLERAIHRGFLVAGVENVPVTIIKETAQECMAKIKPSEWSEEEEENINSLIEVVNDRLGLSESRKEYYTTWLKSLRPSWKPSEEQMEALEECGECKRCIKELREQLKKL